MMWKFQFWSNWKQGALPVATNPCVSVLYHCGTEVATGQEPRQMVGSSQGNTTPPHIGKVLPHPSPMSLMSWNRPRPDSLDSWHQDGKIYCLPWQRKKQYGHILIILFILLRDLFLCMHLYYIRLCGSNIALKCFTFRISASHYSVPTPTGGVQDWRE